MMSDGVSLSFLELHFFSLCCYALSGDGFCSDVSDKGDALELHARKGLQKDVRIAFTIKTADNGGIHLCLLEDSAISAGNNE